jgi:acetyl-CoA C-acetyltransferase
MREVVIVGAARTPIGSFLGTLAPVSAPALGAIAIRAALERAGIAADAADAADAIDEVLMGCVLPAGVGQAPARQAALGAGLPQRVPCTTVNKVCGSGLKTVLQGAQAIALGEADVVVAGGMESMSNAPHLARGLRVGAKMGNVTLEDHMIADGLWDVYNDIHMGSCAEICARDKKIPRDRQDAYAAESYRRALAAIQDGTFRDEIVPVKIASKKGEAIVATDEEPGRGQIDKLGSLKPAFAKDGTVTAGNASSLNDGAAAVVLMAKETAAARGVPTLARIVASGQHAQAPEWFTTAPAGAIRAACQRAGWRPQAVDLWEINEAFAVVSLALADELGLDAARVNVRGGAVALGHPIGASGARILVTLLYAMKARSAKTGGASLCIGGGEGIALLVER